jgi:hypothetical protein
MSKPKLIQINLNAAKDLARLLGKFEEQTCRGCQGGLHEDSCPAREAFQLRNYLTQRINNPNKDYGI